MIMTTETEVQHSTTSGTSGASADPRSSFLGAVLATLERVARRTGRGLSQPRVRTVVIGAALIIVGALIVGHSFWTFPLIAVGVVLILVAWVGSRLEGRLLIEWGDSGAGVEMSARVKSAAARTDATVALPSSEGSGVSGAGEVIDGEAHTMELNPAELRAILAAVDAQAAARDGQATQDGQPARDGQPAPAAAAGPAS